MISVTLVDANTYEVVVGDGTRSVHRVRMHGDYYRKLSGGAFTHEWVLVQAFRFLLEREPSVHDSGRVRPRDPRRGPPGVRSRRRAAAAPPLRNAVTTRPSG